MQIWKIHEISHVHNISFSIHTKIHQFPNRKSNGFKRVLSCFRHMRSAETAERLSLFAAWDLSPQTASEGAFTSLQKCACFMKRDAYQRMARTLCKPRCNLPSDSATSPPRFPRRTPFIITATRRSSAPQLPACRKCALSLPFDLSLSTLRHFSKRPISTSLSAHKLSDITNWKRRSVPDKVDLWLLIDFFADESYTNVLITAI